jgi:cytochrome c peroxidase
MNRWLILTFSCSICFISCDQEAVPAVIPFPELMEVPEGFPPVPEPVENTFSEARWSLGKRLFFDPVLSSDSTISCSSCHLPSFAFSDTRALSAGVEDRPGTRNAPSLANVAYHPYFLREGGVPTLEMQVLVPIQEHNEFDFNILLIAEKLNADSTYRAMSMAAYNRLPDAFVITRAIACFERSLLSGNSPYDQFIFSGEENGISASAIRGRDLFYSYRTHCADCHAGFNFTNYAFANNGLYKEYTDPGRMRLTGKEEDRALFKIPSLRNVELTAPYMHDGSIASLEDVVAHYNKGGNGHIHQSELIQPLGLTADEVRDLVAFLRSLTDHTFTDNPAFQK